MCRKIHLAGVLIISGLPVTSFAGVAPAPVPVCSAINVSLPDDLAAWRGPAKEAISAVVIGEKAAISLRPVENVSYEFPPEKPGKVGTFGGAATFHISTAGTYRIALGAAAWIDVVAHGNTVASITHGHGPECSSIRKIVAFPLKPGRHILQFSGSQNTEIAVLIIPAQ